LADSALQTSAGPQVAAAARLSFAGIGNGDYGFFADAAPPDTNGAVGATQFIHWVNTSFAVFEKSSGTLVYGPAERRGHTVECRQRLGGLLKFYARAA
jgi:hypothetical protein